MLSQTINIMDFEKKHSTTYTATELVDRVIEKLDRYNVLFNIYIDLSKAFDVIDHRIQRIQRIQINLFATTNTFCYGINKQDIQYNYKTNRNY